MLRRQTAIQYALQVQLPHLLSSFLVDRLKFTTSSWNYLICMASYYLSYDVPSGSYVCHSVPYIGLSIGSELALVPRSQCILTSGFGSAASRTISSSWSRSSIILHHSTSIGKSRSDVSPSLCELERSNMYIFLLADLSRKGSAEAQPKVCCCTRTVAVNAVAEGLRWVRNIRRTERLQFFVVCVVATA